MVNVYRKCSNWKCPEWICQEQINSNQSKFHFLRRIFGLVDSREDGFFVLCRAFFSPFLWDRLLQNVNTCQEILAGHQQSPHCHRAGVRLHAWPLCLHTVPGPACTVAWLNQEDLVHGSPGGKQRLTLLRAKQKHDSHTWEAVQVMRLGFPVLTTLVTVVLAMQFCACVDNQT